MLRQLLIDTWRDTVTTCDPEPLTQHVLTETPLSPKRITMLAVGKAAIAMARGVNDVLAELIDRTLIITVDDAPGQSPGGATVLRAGHPTPDKRSVEAARQAVELVRTVSPDHLLLVALSGGGSSLLCAPWEGLTLEDIAQANNVLLDGGVGVEEINSVRKHLSTLKGGRLAIECKAETLVLALSDIPSGNLRALSSGPFAPDRTTYAQAVATMHRVDPEKGLAPAAIAHLERGAKGDLPETPDVDDEAFTRVRSVYVGGPRTLAAAARRALERRRFFVNDLPLVDGTRVAELARTYGERARNLAESGEPSALVAVGEPTVAVTSDQGTGGRSQHLALLMARELRGVKGVAFLAGGSDGTDGPTQVAGAVVDSKTWNDEAKEAVLRFDSFGFHQKAGTAFGEGPTGTNLTDIHVLAYHPG